MKFPELIAQLQALQAVYGDDVDLGVRVGRLTAPFELSTLEAKLVPVDEGGPILLLNTDGDDLDIDEPGEDGEDEEESEPDEEEDDDDDDAPEGKSTPILNLSTLIARLQIVLNESGDLPTLVAFDDGDLNITKVSAHNATVEGNPVLILHMNGIDVEADDEEDDDEEDDDEEDDSEG